MFDNYLLNSFFLIYILQFPNYRPLTKKYKQNQDEDLSLKSRGTKVRNKPKIKRNERHKLHTLHKIRRVKE